MKVVVVNMMKVFVKECGLFGICVNVLLLGFMKMKFVGVLFVDKDIYEIWMMKILLCCYVELCEMVGIVLYFVLDVVSYMNGECIVVDGGLMI